MNVVSAKAPNPRGAGSATASAGRSSAIDFPPIHNRAALICARPLPSTHTTLGRGPRRGDHTPISLAGRRARRRSRRRYRAARWRRSLLCIVRAPDQAIDRYPARNVAQAGDERDEDEPKAEDCHREYDKQVGVGSARVWRDLIPEGIQPEPGLSGIPAGLVHHAPLVANEVLVTREPGEI